jgi:hypothetical protein
MRNECEEHKGQSHYLRAEMESLPESQAVPQRHKCAKCAYELGFKAGRAAAERETQRKPSMAVAK